MATITITDGVYAPALCLTGWVGDLLTIPIQVNDANGNPEDLSSGTIGVTIKGDCDDSDVNAFYKSDVTGPSNGAYTWIIPGSGASSRTSIWWANNTTFPSGEFVVEIVKWDAAGNRNHLQSGKLVIKSSITERLSPL